MDEEKVNQRQGSEERKMIQCSPVIYSAPAQMRAILRFLVHCFLSAHPIRYRYRYPPTSASFHNERSHPIPNPIQSHPHASYMHMTNRFWFHVFPPISFRVLFGISFFFSVTPVSHRQCSQPSIVTVATVIILHPFNCSDSVMMLSYHCQYI